MPRRSPLNRVPTSRPLASIDAGLLTLQVIGSLGFATTTQIRRAVFAQGSQSPRQARARATRSVRQLFDAGFLARVPVFAPSVASSRMSRQVVHVLAASGARVLGLDPRLIRRRRPQPDAVLGHEFWLTELGVLAFESCPSQIVISHWWNDRVLAARKQRGQLHLPTIPDAFLLVRPRDGDKLYPCLIELDLGSESVRAQAGHRRDLTTKIRGYLNYSRSDFATDFGMGGQPIVLIVTQSDRRLASIRSLVHELGGGGRFWVASFTELERFPSSPNPTERPRPNGFWSPVWQTAADANLRSLAWRSGRQMS